MPRLDARLATVARQIRWPIHADIGSDHGHLLKALLGAGRIDRGIAIENKRQPFENSRSMLEGLPAEVRFADGLAGLSADGAEDAVDGVSICGMGGRSILRILSAFPERVPRFVVIQPNRNPELIRQWGINQGFHLVDEQSAAGHWEEGQGEYTILSFVKYDSIESLVSEDPAYQGIDREAALLFGPHFCKRNDSQARARLGAEKQYIMKLDRLDESMRKRLAAIERLLSRP